MGSDVSPVATAPVETVGTNSSARAASTLGCEGPVDDSVSTNRFHTREMAPTKGCAVAGNGFLGEAAVELLPERKFVIEASPSLPLRLVDSPTAGNYVGANTTANFWTTDASSYGSEGGSSGCTAEAGEGTYRIPFGS